MDNQPINYKFFFELRRDLDSLRAEMNELRTFVLEFDKDSKILAQDTTDRIKYFYNAIDVLQDTVAPIEERIFPGVSEARRQLAELIDKRARHEGPEPPPT